MLQMTLKRKFLEYVFAAIGLSLAYLMAPHLYAGSQGVDVFSVIVVAIVGYPFIALFTLYILYSILIDAVAWKFLKSPLAYMCLSPIVFLIESVALVLNYNVTRGQSALDLLLIAGLLSVLFAIAGFLVARKRL